MTDETVVRSEPTPLLAPTVSALAGFTLAVTALRGQTVLSTGLSALVTPAVGSSAAGYYVMLGLCVMAQAALAGWLGTRGAGADEPWAAHLGRASVVVAGLAFLGGVATLLAALFHGSSLG